MKQGRRQKSDWALFLDFDGTLVDIAPSPTSIQIPEELPSLLARLSAALSGAVAIVTGRSVTDLERYVAPTRPAIAGAHGAELRIAPGRFIATAAPIPPRAIDAVFDLCKGLDGVAVEIKRSSIAVHYRSNPEAAPLIEDGLRRLLGEGLEDFALRPGRKVYELVPAHVSKGAAIEALVRFPPFKGRRPLVIGDDSMDETAFEAAEKLGGMGLKVAGEHFSRDVADFDNPSEVRGWLAVFAASVRA